MTNNGIKLWIYMTINPKLYDLIIKRCNDYRIDYFV